MGSQNTSGCHCSQGEIRCGVLKCSGIPQVTWDLTGHMGSCGPHEIPLVTRDPRVCVGSQNRMVLVIPHLGSLSSRILLISGPSHPRSLSSQIPLIPDPAHPGSLSSQIPLIPDPSHPRSLSSGSVVAGARSCGVQDADHRSSRW